MELAVNSPQLTPIHLHLAHREDLGLGDLHMTTRMDPTYWILSTSSFDTAARGIVCFPD